MFGEKITQVNKLIYNFTRLFPTTEPYWTQVESTVDLKLWSYAENLKYN